MFSLLIFLRAENNFAMRDVSCLAGKFYLHNFVFMSFFLPFHFVSVDHEHCICETKLLAFFILFFLLLFIQDASIL